MRKTVIKHTPQRTIKTLSRLVAHLVMELPEAKRKVWLSELKAIKAPRTPRAA